MRMIISIQREMNTLWNDKFNKYKEFPNNNNKVHYIPKSMDNIIFNKFRIESNLTYTTQNYNWDKILFIRGKL